MEGFHYYAAYLLGKRDPAYDYQYRSSFLRTLSNPEAIPDLLLLLEMAKEAEFTKDNFNRLDSIVTDALFKIGLTSEVNLRLVVNGLDNFIRNHQHFEHINFLRVTIAQMEYNFYLNKSQQFSLTDSIKEVEKTGWDV